MIVLFLGNLADAKFCEKKTPPNEEIFLSFTDIGKSWFSCENMTFKVIRKNKILENFRIQLTLSDHPDFT